MNTKQKYEFTDWMIHTVIPEHLELLDTQMIDASPSEVVVRATIGDLKALPVINNAAAWNAVRPKVLSDLSDLSDLRALRALRALGALRDLRDLSALRALSDLSDRFEALYRGHIVTAIERGFIVVPVVENIDAQILAAVESGAGHLDMAKWHRCKTTHCRAGWAINLAGKDGYRLENQFDPATAGALIYIASRPDQPIPNFYASDDAAMADIRKCAVGRTA